MRYRITSEMVEFAVLGGAVLGGGGGGFAADGLKMGRLALEFGHPEILTIDELDDEAVLVTVSAVGSPASSKSPVVPAHYVRALENFRRTSQTPVAGLITNECGGLATINGWLQSAVTGIPVVDAPANGRAHPTGVMGSMGLHKEPSYTALQSAVGGCERLGTYLEADIRGGLGTASDMVRQVAAQCGGLVAVARNPVTAAYAREHTAAGALRRCVELGMTIASARRENNPVDEIVAGFLGGDVAAKGVVRKADIRTSGGFDVGTVIVDSSPEIELVFWNEYVTAEIGGERVATFPDLIATLAPDGNAYTTAQIAVGDEISVLVVPKGRLILGAGVKDPDLFRPIESVTRKQIVRYFA